MSNAQSSNENMRNVTNQSYLLRELLSCAKILIYLTLIGKKEDLKQFGHWKIND